MWTNQVALVTGASRGIGRAIAFSLAQRGAAVCVNFAERAGAAEQVASGIKAAGGHAMTARADVGDFASVRAMVEQTEAHLGPVTILVNNAGLLYQATLETFDQKQFDHMRRINVDGIIHTTRAVKASMGTRGYGRIINLTSIAAIGATLPGNAFYAATKAEAAILTRRFAMELGPDGITVNAVAPGFVRTDMTQGRLHGAEWHSIERHVRERTIAGRIGEPEDVANAVAFLAAPETGWVTAQMLAVDGGRMDYLACG
ncbi:3-oxoacyl-[acyl-carrier protein] reductase [Bradyrhizobium sp. CIR18]|uniref:SDR family NAD(P)-dependent oxidoreductase n=1 Tax=Bradyrhizobium sp. CIR18 TaxID=2663839 RepID=UPI0016066C51|nr:SDR family oxidoreductase [Bradyrhizobium sp. CIR18]MBB4365277.1 3-oxoacyl-[acyl-carrier protein] reductase [Bradyrhizobium sp. CIR18]